MADAVRISCPLCLCAFEPEGLIEIALPHHAFLRNSSVQLCQECCAAVLETCVKRHEEAAPSEQAGEAAGADVDLPADGDRVADEGDL